MRKLPSGTWYSGGSCTTGTPFPLPLLFDFFSFFEVDELEAFADPLLEMRPNSSRQATSAADFFGVENVRVRENKLCIKKMK